jgi:ABC-type multidrug transport system ATPase subunit
VRGPETVRLEKVSKGFYRGRSLLPVLDGTDLVVAPGDSVVRIRGPNAAGKTTLFRVIDGSLRPDSGRCFILGREVTSFPRELRPVYRITQNPFETVAGTLTVRENLRLAAAAGYSLWRRLKPEDRQAAELLEQLGLEEVVTRGTSDGVETLAANLSGGQAQCLAFAMAMAAEPKVILADEPTANLDPVNADVILKLIERVSRRIPIVLVSHDERVSGLADKSLLLSAGRLIEEVGNADRGESRGTV